MGFDFDYRPDDQLLIIRVTSAPAPEEFPNAQAGPMLLRFPHPIGKLLMDLRHQTSSALDAQKARGLLAGFERGIVATRGPDADEVSLAIPSVPGSLGQGIGRMLVGHSYGLDHLKLRQFDDSDAALDWLEVSDAIRASISADGLP